jgi:diguanylate cyclase (GGDEF)-like protein
MLDNSEYSQFLDSVSNPVVVTTPVYDETRHIVDFTIDYVNPAFSRLTHDFTRAGEKYSDISRILPETVDWLNLAVKTITEDTPGEATYYAERDRTWFHMTVDKTRNGRCIFTLSNVSELKKKEKQLTDLVYTDQLTGLSNRTCFNEVFDMTIEASLKNGERIGLMLIDIDDMKSINDISGHVAGDSILRRGAALLSHFENDTIRVFRLGDDEYVVLVTKLESRDRMATICDAIFESFQSASISISAGVSVSPDDNNEPGDLMRYADLAMHSVKKNGKNDVAFFERTMYDTFLHRTLLQEKLLVAAENKSFELYYQPQFNIETNVLRGFEALIRWHDDTFGWIEPEEFMPLAEETRAILPLGKWVMETAAETLRQWKHDYGFSGIMSVNVSPTQLKEASFISDLTKLIKAYGIEPGTFELEITEGIFIDDIRRTVKLLNQIRNLGLLVSLDDFGTGYSSFRYLQYLPLNTLKVDKAFVSNLDSRASVESNITNSIITLVTKMGIETIAEGVERTDQLNALREMRCSNMQGFLRGKPMNKARCDAVLSGDLSLLLRTGSEPLADIKLKK